MKKFIKIFVAAALMGVLVVCFCFFPVSAQTITTGSVAVTNFEVKADSSCSFVVNDINDGGTVACSVGSDGNSVSFRLNPSVTLKVGDIIDIAICLYVTTPAMYDSTYNTVGQIFCGSARSGIEFIDCFGVREHSTKSTVFQNASVNIGGSSWGAYAYLNFNQPSYGNSYHEYWITARFRVVGDVNGYGRLFGVYGLDNFTFTPSDTYNTDRVIQNQNDNTDKIIGSFMDPEYDVPDDSAMNDYNSKESAMLDDANSMLDSGNKIINDSVAATDKVEGLHSGLMAWGNIIAEFIGVPGIDGNNNNLYWLYWLVVIGLALGLATFVIGSVNIVVGRIRSSGKNNKR